MDTSGIVAVITVLISFGALVIAWNKTPHETRQLDSDASGAISEAALALIKPLKDRVTELERDKKQMEQDLRKRLTELEERVSDLEDELHAVNVRLVDVIGGANKLVHQVMSLGADPVYVPPEVSHA